MCRIVAPLCLMLIVLTVCASSAAGQGVFGRRYIEVEGGVLKSADIEGVRSSVGLGLNLPLGGNLDAALAYSYVPSFEASVALVGLAAHTTTSKGLRPFIAVMAARQSVKGRKHNAWGVSGGVELLRGESIAFRPSVAYSRVRSESGDPFRFLDAGVAFTAWVNERIFFDLSAGYGFEIGTSSRDGTWSAALGLGFRV